MSRCKDAWKPGKGQEIVLEESGSWQIVHRAVRCTTHYYRVRTDHGKH